MVQLDNRNVKKILILFSILILPYILVVWLEKGTHNILSLGYLENEVFEMDSLGEVHTYIDSTRVPSFKLLNQDENYITDKYLLGSNYIVHFFFSSCPTVCVEAMPNLLYLQKKIHDYGIESFKLISISVDPENDTPQRLKEYAIRNGVDLSNWEFLTGSEEEIYDLAQSGFHIAAAQDSLAPGGVFHSADITIVDDRGYIRTGLDKKKNIKFVYDGTSTTDIKLLVGEIQRLTITDFKDNYEIKQK